MRPTRKSTRTQDAVAILRKRYVRTPAREQELELARINATIARDIYQLRVGARLTQEQLGRLIGTTGSVISRLEDDDYQGHSLPMLLKISQVLHRRVELRLVPQRIARGPARGGIPRAAARKLRVRNVRYRKVTKAK